MRRLTEKDICKGQQYGSDEDTACAMGWTKRIGRDCDKALAKKLSRKIVELVTGITPDPGAPWETAWGNAIVRWNDWVATKQQIADAINAAAESVGLLDPVAAPAPPHVEVQLRPEWVEVVTMKQPVGVT